ncbi:hypothetical protein [Mycobacterium hubeiense]|uniref:hypothetical protein n=1 Tax=Mycobacterium hubeiense TaxID=1867256 RepID=UPI00115BF1D9|nr:hypothetical protein [Mycobacterium sp. QGD 101]
MLANQVSSAEMLAEVAQVLGGGLLQGFTTDSPALIQQALADFAAGDITNALNNIVGAVLGPVVAAALPLVGGELDPFAVIQNPFENLSNVVNAITNPLTPGLLAAALAPVTMLSDINLVLGSTGEALIGAVEEGNPEAFANAALSFAPKLTGAILNGEYGSGLIGPYGLVSSLLTLRQAVADAIEPLVPAAEEASLPAVNETAGEAAATVNLSTAEVAEPTKPAASKTESVDTGASDTAAAGAAAVTADKVEASTTEEVAPSEKVDASADNTQTAAGTTTVKDSPMAVPGKTGTTTSERTNPVKQVRDGIRGTVKNVTDGLKKAAEGISGKNRKGESTSGSNSSAGSGDGAGSGSSSSDAA